MSRRPTFLLVLTALVAPALRAAAEPARPAATASVAAVDLPSFTAEPSALLAAANGDADGHDVIVLLNEGVHTFEADGRGGYRNRLLVRVVTAAGAREWTSWWCSYRPWREERPTLRARVITPDGQSHAIDPKTIEEGAIEGEGEDDMYSDARRIRAPLPAVMAGAVVEEECDHKEARPAIEGVVQSLYLFGLAAPKVQTRLVLDAPRSLPLTYVARLLPELATRREELGDRVRLTLTMGPMAALGDEEPLLPPDVPPRPYVAWSTVKSWGEVARYYAKRVDEQLASGDLGAVARQAIGSAGGREERAAALLEKVHREVRYTGVELGEGAMVPRPPLEVLQRRFGDCKDQATLLVGLLRAVGIAANVALLRAGTGFDGEPTLPDLGNFNHAIVYLPAAGGAPAIWIDPTERFARPGQLPLGDQGRSALIAGGDGKLVRTPISTATDNGDVETREIVLPESGRAHVVETSTMRGSFEISLRSRAAVNDDKKLRESIAGYARQEYAADNLDNFTVTDPDALTKPMTMRIEASEARAGVSGLDGMEGAEVAIAVHRIATPYLPAALRDEPSEEEKQAERESAPRASDYFFPEPFTVEWSYRVVPPPGFMPAQLPAKESRRIGPATLSREFKSDDKGVVSASFRFDTGNKRRLSGDEARGLRDGMVALKKEGDLIFRFVQRGESALAAGRIGEALDEFRRLAALHPKEALHHGQMARALLRGGLGDAARAEAQLGVALEPQSPDALRTLAFVLEHDLFGRNLHAGFDRAGAEAALKKAKALAPRESMVRVELAILDGYDDQAVRYSPRARLDDAVSEYRALQADLKDERFRSNLLFPLFFAHRYPELEREARAEEASDTRNVLLVATVALTHGVPAAIAEAERLQSDPAHRRDLLSQAADKVLAQRGYDQAAALLERASEGADDGAAVSARARVLRKVRRVDEKAIARDDPTWPARELFVRLTRGAGSADDLFVYPDSAGSPGAAAQAMKSAFRRAIPGLPDEALADLILGVVELTSSGDDAVGYRVRVTSPGAGEAMRLYVVRANDKSGARRYRILGDGDTLWPIARRALELVARNDLDGARRWLDWARQECHGGEDDPVAVRPFTLFWSRGQSGSADEIRAAAAALLADDASTAKEAIPTLTAARDQAPPEQRYRYEMALLTAHAALGQWDEVLAAAERVAAREPDSETLFWRRFVALFREGKAPEAEALGRARLARFKDDPAALRALADNAAHRGDFPAVQKLYQRLIDVGNATPGDFNQAAWSALFVEPFDGKAVELARQAVERSGRKRAESLHTLATLQAEDGRTAEAYQTLLESLDVAHADDPRPHDYYVLARIAEKLSLKEAALSAYRRAATAPDRKTDALSVAWLADRRIASLTQAGPADPKSPPDRTQK